MAPLLERRKIMTTLSLTWLLNLTGELEDGSGASRRFRENLQNKNVSVADLAGWVYEAIEKSGKQYHRALQDLVNALGLRLGFEVEFGVYQGQPGVLNADGVWISSTGQAIIVETKTTETYQIDPDTLVGYIQNVATKRDIAEEDVYGLYVLGKYEGLFEKTIKGSGHQHKIRIITCDDLLKLIRLMQANALTHDQILSLMMPFETVNVGSLIKIIEDIIAVQRPEEEEKTEAETPTKEPWKENGQKYHLDKQTPEQRAKLIELVDLIQEVNPELAEPSWNQKFYISFSHPAINPMWASISDWRLSFLSLETRNKQGVFDEGELTEKLGMKVTKKTQGRYDWIEVAIYPNQEIDTPAFRAFLKQSLQSLKDLFGVSR
jgi:hypothetical protein